MGFKIDLSGGAIDVLRALFFRGALPPGDIPSKSGAKELGEAGLVHTHHTATPFGGEDYFTYLTAEGQKFAIQYLVETRFGEVKDKPSMEMLRGMQEAIADSLDDVKELCIGAYDLPEGKTPVIFLVDRYTAIGGKYTPEEIRDAIECIHAGRQEKADKKLVVETCLNEALIQPGSIQAVNIYAGHNFKPASDERRMEDVALVPEKMLVNLDAYHTFNPNAATKIRLTDDMREAVLDVVRESDLFQSLQAEQSGQTASVDNLQQKMQQAATDAIRNALKPGGLLYGNR
ncbi:hypothetical protein [Franconibacter helveticus]|uniref:hypothetical protein n=1 Tax=Franconibacter helveticus TaxID=357240 RepID=UPI000DA1236F|nr:hypothetical protein [Franconibacter helveticus]